MQINSNQHSQQLILDYFTRKFIIAAPTKMEKIYYIYYIMILTTRTRYAVMAIIDMIDIGCDKPISLESISKRQDISLSYLEQIFSKLRKGGIVTSAKGPGGGYTISKNLKEITIANIVDAMEETIKMTKCNSKEKGCMGSKKCRSHNLWHGLEKNIHSYFASVSLADICADNLTSNQTICSN